MAADHARPRRQPKSGRRHAGAFPGERLRHSAQGRGGPRSRRWRPPPPRRGQSARPGRSAERAQDRRAAHQASDRARS